MPRSSVLKGTLLSFSVFIIMANAGMPLLAFTNLFMHGTLIFVALFVLTKKRFRGQFGIKRPVKKSEPEPSDQTE